MWTAVDYQVQCLQLAQWTYFNQTKITEKTIINTNKMSNQQPSGCKCSQLMLPFLKGRSVLSRDLSSPSLSLFILLSSLKFTPLHF